MSAAAAGVVRLDKARARALTRRLRDALDLSLDLLTEAFHGRAWEVLGYASWSAYCAAELPALALLGKGMPAEQRQGVVVELRRQGMSHAAIAKPLGVGVGTVHRDLEAAGVSIATTESLDGRRRPGKVPAAAAPSRPRARKTDRAVELVAAAGPEGLTVRDLVAATRWNQCQASATLHRLERAGRVRYLQPARRGLFGRYAV